LTSQFSICICLVIFCLILDWMCNLQFFKLSHFSTFLSSSRIFTLWVRSNLRRSLSRCLRNVVNKIAFQPESKWYVIPRPNPSQVNLSSLRPSPNPLLCGITSPEPRNFRRSNARSMNTRLLMPRPIYNSATSSDTGPHKMIYNYRDFCPELSAKTRRCVMSWNVTSQFCAQNGIPQSQASGTQVSYDFDHGPIQSNLRRVWGPAPFQL